MRTNSEEPALLCGLRLGLGGTSRQALDESSRVRAWAKSLRLGLEIPYQHNGEAHAFIPDFLVVHSPAREDGVEHVVVEVKGLEREQDRSKDVGAQRWIAAVNRWGKLGHWRYVKIHSPYRVKAAIVCSCGYWTTHDEAQIVLLAAPTDCRQEKPRPGRGTTIQRVDSLR